MKNQKYRWPRLGLSLVNSLILLLYTSSSVHGQQRLVTDATPGLWIRPVGLEKVWSGVIDLTRGTRFKSPAEAVASAKASGLNPYGGNKTLEAAISIFNPEIGKFFGMLDKSVVSVKPDQATKTVNWRMGLSQDDGTLESLITALRLESPIIPTNSNTYEEISPGLTAARNGSELYFGSSQREIEYAIKSRTDMALLAEKPPMDAGLWLVANPAKWPPAIARNMNESIGLQTVRRLAAGNEIEIRLFPWGESVQAECLDLFRAAPVSPVQSAWLTHWEKALGGRLMAQASLGLDPRKPFWNQLFTIVTEIERSIPGREKVASVRDRINIGALLARISPETDIYPNLNGLTVGAVTPDAPNVQPTVVATLHARDQRATQILVEKVVMPLFRTIGDDPKNARTKPSPTDRDSRIRGISLVQNRPIYLFIEEKDIFLVWGARNVAEAMVSHLASKPAKASVTESWFNQLAASGPVHRAITIYPEALVRWQIIEGEKSTVWTDSATGLPPVVWLGRNTNGASRDIIVFSGARAYVQSLTSRIPNPELKKE